MKRMALSVALLSILLLVSCLGRYVQRTDLSSENVMVNRIAYVDSLGIVYTVVEKERVGSKCLVRAM